MKKNQILTDDTFDENVLQSDTPVLVNFTATWASPCKRFNPTLKSFAETRGDIHVAKVDVGGNYHGAPSDNPELFTRYDIRVFPTLLLFRDGKVAGMAIGEMDEEKLAAWTKAILDNPVENDIAPDAFKAYSQQFFSQLEQQCLQQNINTNRKVFAAKSVFNLACAGFLATVGGPFGMIAAAPIGAKAAIEGSRAALNNTESPRPINRQPFRSIFNLASTAGGMALMAAPVTNLGGNMSNPVMTGVALVVGLYLFISGSAQLLGDMVEIAFGKKRQDPEPRMPANQNSMTENDGRNTGIDGKTRPVEAPPKLNQL